MKRLSADRFDQKSLFRDQRPESDTERAATCSNLGYFVSRLVSGYAAAAHPAAFAASLRRRSTAFTHFPISIFPYVFTHSPSKIRTIGHQADNAFIMRHLGVLVASLDMTDMPTCHDIMTILSGTRRSTRREASAFIDSQRVPTAYSRHSMFGPSVSPATMASADFCKDIPTPLDVSSTRHPCRPPRVSRTHLHAYVCRIYTVPFRASTGLRRYSPPHPDTSPPIRFLFVRPALCLRLPPDSQSPATPLPFG
jgi:hypothetical protein